MGGQDRGSVIRVIIVVAFCGTKAKIFLEQGFCAMLPPRPSGRGNRRRVLVHAGSI